MYMCVVQLLLKADCTVPRVADCEVKRDSFPPQFTGKESFGRESQRVLQIEPRRLSGTQQLRMTRFTAAQFAAAAAAGVPRASAEFADDDAWQEYQQSWLEVFRPHEKLPPPEDKQRRLVWKAATRQHGKIEAARNAAAAVNIVLVAAPQPPSHGSSSLPGDTDAEASGVAVVEAVCGAQ